MHITAQNKELLVKEIDFVINKMANIEAPQQKLYYFSGIFTLTNRIFNFKYDSELALIHNVMKTAHATISANLPTFGPNQPIAAMPPMLFGALREALIELREAFNTGKPSYQALERISDIAYSTTGNGYYLWEKGELKI